VIVDFDALVTAREAQDHPGLKALGVCRHMICDWRAAGRLAVRARRGRSPLYRFGDVLVVERDMRLKKRFSHRSKECRSCLRVAERVAA
jgi:hypothetical protein